MYSNPVFIQSEYMSLCHTRLAIIPDLGSSNQVFKTKSDTVLIEEDVLASGLQSNYMSF